MGSNLRFPRRAETRSSDEYEKFMLLGTLHGVACLFGEDRDLLLWNPAIRKFSILPLPDITMDFEWDHCIFTEGCFGFWIDPCNKEFKIIVFNLELICDEEGEYMDVYGVLYSSVKYDWRVIPLGELGKWKPLQECPTKMEGRVGDWRPSDSDYCAPIMIGGVGYWKGHYSFKNEEGYHHESANVILSFDFVQESFEFLEMPFLEYSTSVDSIPFQWQGTLSLLYWESYSLGCEIYSSQEGSWVSMFRFNLISPVYSVYWVLGEMEDSFRFLAEAKDGLVVYDTKDGIGCISFKGEYFEDLYTCVAYDIVESLLFPTSVNPNRQLLIQ